jgi:alpha-L-fucosidase
MFSSFPALRMHEACPNNNGRCGQYRSFLLKFYHLFFAFFAGFAAVQEIFGAISVDELTWELFRKNPRPQWPAEDKFGILVCWGPYSVPAFDNEWYPRNMYIEGHPAYLHHREKYGDPSRFGYKDFFPLFTAERFSPDEWAALFKKAGARFAGLVAEHIDGFSMWSSRVNRWNAGQMGPRRSIAPELTSALQKQGLKTILSFYHAYPLQNPFPVKEGWDTADPQYADLYGTFLDPVVGVERWLAKIQEAVEQCQPDSIHFGPGLNCIPEETKRRLVGFLENRRDSFGKTIRIVYFNQDFPEGLGLPAYEPAHIQTVQPSRWLAFDSIAVNSRSYTDSLRLKSLRELILELVDVISKNGVFLLTISPQADGTIPSEQQQILSELGQWLQVNGRAVYPTRPWDLFGEGIPASDSSDLTPPLLRFAAREGTLYLFVFDWPHSPLQPESVEVRSVGPRARVRLLGLPQDLRFQVNQNRRLEIEVPDLAPAQRPPGPAYVFELEGFELRADAFYGPDAITLEARSALLEGDRLRRQKRPGGSWIIWEEPREKIHWLVHVRKAGRYALRLEGTAAIGPVWLILSCASEKIRFQVPRTDDWNTLRLIDAGAIRFPRPGVYHLILQPADLKNWRPLNLCRIRLTPQ